MNPAGTSLAPRRTKTQSSSLQLSRGVDAAETRPSWTWIRVSACGS